MQESYGEGVAIHTGPESCVDARKGGCEALTGERTGRAFSRERAILRDADAFGASGRPHSGRRYRKTPRSPARSQTPSMSGYTSYETRESPCPPAADGAAGRVGKSMDTRR
jgi:RNA-directed DNA polymerase